MIFRRSVVLKKTLVQLLSLSVVCLAVFMTCDNGTGPTPPAKTLEIVAPKGGESYKVGQTVTIKWKINDATKISSVGIKLSPDNGKTIPNIDLETSSIFPPTDSFSWTITSDQASTQCVIKVYDYLDKSINDQSGVFTVSN